MAIMRIVRPCSYRNKTYKIGKGINQDKVVYSVIVDQKNQWQQAFEKMPQLRHTKVLFDPNKIASRDYNALNVASSMHRGFYPGHTYFLIDREGIVRYYLDDPQMAIRNDQIYPPSQKTADVSLWMNADNPAKPWWSGVNASADFARRRI